MAAGWDRGSRLCRPLQRVTPPSRNGPTMSCRMKDVAQEQYTQGEAEFAAGMTKEVLPPAHGGGGGVGMVVG